MLKPKIDNEKIKAVVTDKYAKLHEVAVKGATEAKKMAREVWSKIHAHKDDK